MPTTTNFGWTTPADTDLVKDGAAAIRTALNGVDTSFLDLKGGTTGQVLAKATNTDLDFTWTTTSAPADNFQLINAGGTALTGAGTITVSGISGKNSLYIWVAEASSASASSYFYIRFNTDSTSNYRYAGLSLQNVTMAQVRTNPSDTELEFARQGTSAANAVTGFIRVEGANAAGSKPYISSSSAGGATPGDSNIYLGSYEGTSTISSVSIVSSVGNFDAGTIYVYGA